MASVTVMTPQTDQLIRGEIQKLGGSPDRPNTPIKCPFEPHRQNPRPATWDHEKLAGMCHACAKGFGWVQLLDAGGVEFRSNGRSVVASRGAGTERAPVKARANKVEAELPRLDVSGPPCPLPLDAPEPWKGNRGLYTFQTSEGRYVCEEIRTPSSWRQKRAWARRTSAGLILKITEGAVRRGEDGVWRSCGNDDPDAHWVDGVGELPLFNAPALAGEKPGATVLLCAGPKNATQVEALGFVSTSKPHGENKPLSETQLEQLREFRTVVVYDADPTGREWREKDVAQLKASGIAAVALADLGATEKYDIGDFIDDRRSSGSSDDEIANAIHAMISEAWRGKKLDLPRATLSIAAPFPVEAMPEVARVTTLAIAERTQVDLAMAACAVLAVGCLAVQHLFDVEVYESLREPDWTSRMPRKQPLSLAVVAVAGPSERKTTTLAAALEGIRRHEHNLTEDYRAAQQDWENEVALHKQAHRRILDSPQLRDDQKREQLADLGPLPLAPPPPTLTPPDPTIEATIDLMSSAVPTLGLISAEGAIFLGGYSMNQDRIARSAAMLSKLVDGEGHVDLRRKGKVVVASAARLCLCLFLQPEVVDDVLFGTALENQGLTSRLLIAFPAPKAGTRFTGTSKPWVRQAISRWADLTQQLVSLPAPQERPVICISSEAMELLDELYNDVESELGPGGSLERYRTFAGKICAHVVRIAAVLQVLEHAGSSGGLLSADSVRAGWEVARWFLDERRRIATEVTSNQEIERLDRLAAWLSQWRKGCELVSPCEVQQRANRGLRSTYSSMPGRQAANILADLEELETRGFLRGLEGSHVIAEPGREPVRRVKNVFQIVGYTDR